MMSQWAWFGLGALAGTAVGFLTAYFFSLRAATSLDVRLHELQGQLNVREAELSAERLLKDRLENEFKVAASNALHQMGEQFLTSALKDLRQARTESDHGIEQQKQVITQSVADMKSRLEDTQRIVQKFEQERSSMYAKLEQTLTQVLSAEQALRIETSTLKSALTSSSGIRGHWGERVLREILEQNDFVQGYDFESQVSVSDDQGESYRPDFVIRLPGNKRLVVDSKEVTSEYILAQEATDPARQKEHYSRLVQNIRDNFIKLGRKEYQAQLDRDIPFVVMFIPSEAAIRAAFSTDPGLFEEATRRKVILASPMTIIPLVYLIRNGWQQQRLAENARELSAAVETLGDRLYTFVGHMQGIQAGLRKAIDGWNEATGSWQRRVSPQIDKAKNLGGRFKDLPELGTVDAVPRSLEEISAVEEKKQ